MRPYSTTRLYDGKWKQNSRYFHVLDFKQGRVDCSSIPLFYCLRKTTSFSCQPQILRGNAHNHTHFKLYVGLKVLPIYLYTLPIVYTNHVNSGKIVENCCHRKGLYHFVMMVMYRKGTTKVPMYSTFIELYKANDNHRIQIDVRRLNGFQGVLLWYHKEQKHRKGENGFI